MKRLFILLLLPGALFAADFKQDGEYLYIRDIDQKLCMRFSKHIDLNYFAPDWVEWSATMTRFNWPTEPGACFDSYQVKTSWWGNDRPLYNRVAMIERGEKVKIGRVLVGTKCESSPNVGNYRPVSGGMAICEVK